MPAKPTINSSPSNNPSESVSGLSGSVPFSYSAILISRSKSVSNSASIIRGFRPWSISQPSGMRSPSVSHNTGEVPIDGSCSRRFSLPSLSRSSWPSGVPSESVSLELGSNPAPAPPNLTSQPSQRPSRSLSQ